MNDKKRLALDVISEACETHQCSKVFCLFSGGDDSLAALRVAVEHPRFTAAVHLNTGIGAEPTREFAHETCKGLHCPLIEYKATENVNAKGQPDPQVYEEMVLQYGFPGPTKFGHGKMYTRLKERGIRRLLREHTNGKEKVVLASGCRQEESQRRMGTTKRIQQGEASPTSGIVREPRRVWVNHLFDWSKVDCLSLASQHNLPRNPCSVAFGRSLECACGAYAKDGELEEMLACDLTRPLARRILELEKKVTDAGFPWRWHEGPPRWWLEQETGQMFLADYASRNNEEEVGPLCQQCEIKRMGI